MDSWHDISFYMMVVEESLDTGDGETHGNTVASKRVNVNIGSKLEQRSIVHHLHLQLNSKQNCKLSSGLLMCTLVS